MLCFGVANNSPEKVLNFLSMKGLIRSPSEVSVVPSGKTLAKGKRPKRRFIFLVNFSDVIRNLETLNSIDYRKVNVFVFASPLRLNELTHCVHLDFEHEVGNRGIGFKIHRNINLARFNKGRQRDSTVPITHVNRKYLSVLTDNVKHGSLLTPLMTFIYTLPRATHQTPVKETVARFLYGSVSLASMEAELSELLSERNLSKLRSLVTSEVAVSYRSAFREVKADTSREELKAICKKWNVNDYEVSYIQSVLENQKARKRPVRKRR